MNCLTNEELRDNYFKASDRYWLIVNSRLGNLFLLQQTVAYRKAKSELDAIKEEMRKRQSK